MTAADVARRPASLQTPAPAPGHDPAGGVLRTAAAVLRHWRLVTLFSVLGALAFGVPALLKDRVYESSASFMPQARRGMSGVSGIAMQLGVALPQAEGGQSPQFYAELLKSPEILRGIVTDTFTFALPDRDTKTSQTLIDRERAEDPDLGTALLVQNAIERLSTNIAVTVSAKTGVVNFSVTEEDPALARDIAGRLVAELNRFNLETRMSQAAAERQFTERRLNEAAEALREAEVRRQQFSEQNRAFGASSRLALQQERYDRDVQNAQQVYTMMLTAYEQAKIDEVRDTPVITVVEPPREPVRPVSRGVAMRALLGLLIGLGLGVLVALMRRHVREWRATGAPAWLEFESALRRSR